MKYFIDSADINQITKWSKLLGRSCAGVTTNSAMLKDTEAIVSFLRNYQLGKTVMVQVNNETDLDKIPELTKVVFKTSMLEENFDLINSIRNLGSDKKLAGTTCYDLIQINQAIEMGMNYSMVYYAKNDYKGLLEDAVKLKRDTNSAIRLVAASIHTPEEVTHALKSGIGYVTVRPDVLELLFNNEQAVEDLRCEKERV